MSEIQAEIKLLQEEVVFLSTRQNEIHKLRYELYVEEDTIMERKTLLMAVIGDLAVGA